jgi:hypothetical protein
MRLWPKESHHGNVHILWGQAKEVAQDIQNRHSKISRMELSTQGRKRAKPAASVRQAA